MALSTMYPAKANSPQTELAADITAADTSMTVLDATVLPTAPNLCTLGSDEDAEVVSYTTITGNVVSGLVRGQSGTTASVWTAGTPVARDFTSYDHDTFKGNIEDLDTNKAPLASPDLTGTPTAPTASSGTNTTQIATTAYVQGELAKEILYFYQQSTSVTSASTSEFCRITDSRIDTDTVVLNMSFSDSSYITSGISWSSASGYISLKGICTNSNCKVNIVLGQKGN